MAETTAAASSTGPYLEIAGFLLLLAILPIFLFLIFSSQNSNPQQPIDTTPGSAQSAALNSLLANTNTSAFLTANASQISQLISQATTTENQLQNADPIYKSLSDADRQSAIALLTDIQTKLPQLQPAGVQTSQVAKSLAEDIQKLNALLPSVGAQLDVPVVTQGDNGWCGRTAMDMIAMYYNHNQVPTAYASSFSGTGTTLTSTKTDIDAPSADHLDQMSGKTGWVQVGIGHKTVDQLFSAIKASIDGKDPILMYTYGVYYSKNHIVVITGYDAASRTIIVNSSATADHNGTRKNIRTSMSSSNPIPVTIDFIYKQLAATEGFYTGDGGGHSFIIQSKYWS